MPVAEIPARICTRQEAGAPDAALVPRMQAGDEGAFEAIFKRHHAPLLSYCRHVLGDQDEAEDALQQAFIKAHQAMLGGTAPRELRPWLYAIARNCCLSAIAARKPTAALADDAPSLAGLSDQVHQREDLRELLAGIGRLPEDQRSALLLAELDDLSHQVIATIVGCPVNRVKALVYQARSALIADRDARNTPCQDIREQLSVAHGGELRRGPLRRHLKLCAGCRDFQLAVGAQRQSLAAVLPVAPSAGLAAVILGHGAAHAAAAAGAGGAGGGLAPAGGVVGTGVGATATGGTGIATTGTTAATTAVGAGAGASAGGGTSVGALIGGGLITKLAVGGTVVALATAGAVTVHNRLAHGAIPHQSTHLQLVSSPVTGRRSVAAYTGSSGPPSSLGPGSAPGPALSNGTSPPGPAGSAGPEPSTELSALGGANPLLTPPNTLTPSLVGPYNPGQPAVKAGGSRSSAGRDPSARAKHRAALRRRRLRRARRLRKAHRRARLRMALRKALRHHHRLVTPKPQQPPAAPAPASVRAHHRIARPTPAPGTIGQSTGTPTTGSESHGARGRHHRSAAGTGTTSTGTGTGAGATGTGGGKAGSGIGTGKAGSRTGAGNTGSGTSEGKASGSGSGKAGGGTGITPSKTKAGGGAGGTPSKAEAGGGERSGTGSAGSTSGTGGATEQSPTTTGTSETTGGGGAGATRGQGTTPRPKKHLVEEEQLPNF